MPETYGYVRTSLSKVSELSGGDPETQRQQLLAAGVALSHIYQEIGVSGTSGSNRRQAWHSLDSRMAPGDTLVNIVGMFIREASPSQVEKLHFAEELLSTG